jgi:predicted helicase
MPNLGAVLSYLRANSTGQRAKATYLVAFLRQDAGMQQQFSKVWLYADWATQNGQLQTDAVIDIVGEVREGSVCSAQRKFYSRS